MNWYSIFYWMTVADGVKSFFDSASNTFITFAVLSFIAYGFVTIGYSFCIAEEESKDDKEDEINPNIRAFKKLQKPVKTVMYWSLILTIITWTIYALVPSKKDMLLIVAAGSVGNFITSDSSAKQIPAEVTLLVREKLKAEIKEIQSGVNKPTYVDTLATKTKEELIELLKEKSK